MIRWNLPPEEVGERIKRAREAKMPKAWSQFDLAIALDVSPSTVYRWEKGRLPTLNQLLRVAEVLDLPPDHLTEPPEQRVELGEIATTLASLDARLARIEGALGLGNPQT